MQIDRGYINTSIDLGSYQYSGIAKHYTLFENNQLTLPNLYKKILNERESFKKEIYNLLDKEYKRYEQLRHKKISELNISEKNEFFLDYGSSTDEYRRMQSYFSEEPFKFPVKPCLQKIALLELINFKKNQAWDLWTLCNYFRNNLFHSFNDSEYIDELNLNDNRYDAALIYAIKETMGLDDSIVEKYFGGFDT